MLIARNRRRRFRVGRTRDDQEETGDYQPERERNHRRPQQGYSLATVIMVAVVVALIVDDFGLDISLIRSRIAGSLPETTMPRIKAVVGGAASNATTVASSKPDPKVKKEQELVVSKTVLEEETPPSNAADTSTPSEDLMAEDSAPDPDTPSPTVSPTVFTSTAAPEPETPQEKKPSEDLVAEDSAPDTPSPTVFTSTSAPEPETPPKKKPNHCEDQMALPFDATVPHATDLHDAGLCQSLAHQTAFHSLKDKVLSWVNSNDERKKQLLFKGLLSSGSFAHALGKEWALRHTKRAGVSDRDTVAHNEVDEKQQLLAVVEDPIDHFLNGWRTVGIKKPDCMMNLTTSENYDDRIRAWLDLPATGIKQFIKDLPEAQKTKIASCRFSNLKVFSYPQANFLWTIEGNKYDWDPRLSLVGDVRELPGLLEILGAEEDTIPEDNNSDNEDENISAYFEIKRKKLSTETLQAICRYVALDYYLFDFTPPEPCRTQLAADMVEIMNTT